MNNALDISLESSIYIEDLFEMYGHPRACNCFSMNLIRQSTMACNQNIAYTVSCVVYLFVKIPSLGCNRV